MMPDKHLHRESLIVLLYQDESQCRCLEKNLDILTCKMEKYGNCLHLMNCIFFIIKPTIKIDNLFTSPIINNAIILVMSMTNLVIQGIYFFA